MFVSCLLQIEEGGILSEGHDASTAEAMTGASGYNECRPQTGETMIGGDKTISGREIPL
jgi:hypothetical protein